MDSHILLVDSNVADARTGSNNTCSSFVNILDPPLDLGDEDFEVGIKEIQYPITWFNITKNAHCVLLYRKGQGTGVYTESSEPFVVLSPGRYTDVNNILAQINVAIKQKFLLHHKGSGSAPAYIRYLSLIHI